MRRPFRIVRRSEFRAPSSAFTLVEILASLLFLAIAVPAIVGALGVASRTSEVAERSSIAGELAENKLNEMLVDNGWQGAAQTNGDFGTDYPNFRWQITTGTWAGSGVSTGLSSSSTAGSSTMTELAVDVFYQVQGVEHSVHLATLVNPSNSVSSTNGTSTSTSTSTGTTK